MNVVGMSGRVENGLEKAWWKEALIYQVYPRSFMDSDGDGIGDLNGILQKVDYLEDLGVDVLWLSPIYKSPNYDNGYDISDYLAIMDEFGSMEDFERLLKELNRRGIKLIMDLVINHTSDEHAWFQQARKSKDNEYRNFYIWRAPVGGGPPNNWRSFFGGSAWEYDEGTGEYYLHLFSKKQPDLNWQHVLVRQEVYSIMRFWLDKGISGFRVDAFPYISKSSFDISYRGEVGLDTFYANGPKLHAYLQEMHVEVLAHYDAVTAGEAPGVSPELAPLFVARDRKEFDMLFHFDHVTIDRDPKNSWRKRDYSLLEFKEVFERWDNAIGKNGWGTVYLGNHDTARMVSHFGEDGKFRELSAKMLATLLLSQRGTPVIYQGDELGMCNVMFEGIEQYRDIESINAYDEYVGKGEYRQADFIHALNVFSRDNARTPMQWDSSKNAGFSSGRPWIDVNPNYLSLNAQQQSLDRHSVLNYYKKLIELRKSYPIFIYGDWYLVRRNHSQLFIFTITLDSRSALVALNFSAQKIAFAPAESVGELLLSNYIESERSQNMLRAFEARVYLQ